MEKALKILNALQNGTPMLWNDPSPIDDNDYRITSIFGLEGLIKEFKNDDLDESDCIVLIQYGGGSEAEVYISEIEIIE
jgi:hypothetical protein